MAFCTKCGAQLENGATFCVFCGATQTPDSDVNPYAVGTNYSGSAYSSVDPNAPIIPGFGEAIKICFSKYVDFKGRASRSEYWYWTLFCLIVGWIPLAGLVVLLPTISVFVRRMHDTNHSGWWWWLPGIASFIMGMLRAMYESGDVNESVVLIGGLIALAACVVTFVFLVRAGTPGPNKYGPAPVQR